MIEENVQRAMIWKQLIQNPKRDTDTIVLVCAEQGIDVRPHYVRCTRVRWRNTISALKEAGATVPAA